MLSLKSLKTLLNPISRITLKILTHYFRLTRISLVDNPVWEEEDLRIRLLIKINSLKVINKEEVTEDERLEVKELLQTQQEAGE